MGLSGLGNDAALTLRGRRADPARAAVRLDAFARILECGPIQLVDRDLLVDHALREDGLAVRREGDSLRPAPHPRGCERVQLGPIDAVETEDGLVPVEGGVLRLVAPV